MGCPSQFCTRPYRFSTVPEKLAKFRSGFFAVAHLEGQTFLSTRLRIPLQHCQRYLAAMDAGRTSNNAVRLVHRKITTQPDLCELIGACERILQVTAARR